MGNQSKEIQQAVIWAGGRGERLRPLTDRIPKPLAPVGNAVFLDYLLQSLVDVGIRKILLLVGYKGEMIMQRYGRFLKNGIKVEYSFGDVHFETGRRLLNAYELLDDRFLLLYGDNYWPVELPQMMQLYQQKGASALVTVFSNKKGTGEYGYANNIEVGSDQFIKSYDKSRKAQGLNGVDISYFLMDKAMLDPKVTVNVSFEERILPHLIVKRELIGYVTDRQYYYITDAKSLQAFSKIAKESSLRQLILQKGKR